MTMTREQRLARVPLSPRPQMACDDEALRLRLRAATRIWVAVKSPNALREIDRLLDELNRRRLR